MRTPRGHNLTPQSVFLTGENLQSRDEARSCSRGGVAGLGWALLVLGFEICLLRCQPRRGARSRPSKVTHAPPKNRYRHLCSARCQSKGFLVPAALRLPPGSWPPFHRGLAKGGSCLPRDGSGSAQAGAGGATAPAGGGTSTGRCCRSRRETLMSKGRTW